MRSWATSLFALLLAGAAQATPPEIVDVEDRLFARTEDRLYLLRSFTSNDGLHGVTRTDILQITRTLDPGDDRGFRGVARQVDLGPWHEGGPRVQTVPLQNPADPYGLLADGAWPLQDPDPTPLSGAILLPTGLHGTALGPTGRAAYLLPMSDLSARIVDTLSASRAILPFQRLGGGSTGPDPFDPALYNPARDCRVTATLPLSDYETDPLLARILCQDEDELQRATLWLVVPRADD